MKPRRPSAEIDEPVNFVPREEFEARHAELQDTMREMRKSIEDLGNRYRTFTPTLISCTVAIVLAVMGGWWKFSNDVIAVTSRNQERISINSGLTLKQQDELDKLNARLTNYEAGQAQLGQQLTDHIDTDNSRWVKIGGQKEKK